MSDARIRRAAWTAGLLWVLFAFVVWHVVFDRVLVVAGRQFVHAASTAARDSGEFLRVGDWMQPAIERGLWIASGAAGSVLALGFAAVALAVRRDRSRQHEHQVTRT